MSMDITGTIQPDSTQINADDLIGGPVTVTIREVTKGKAEQPVNIHLQEYPDRAYRPSKTMRRVIVSAWGPDASTYAGRRMTLFRNPDIRFGKEVVGGIQISALSHIDKPLKQALTVARGKRQSFVVHPLKTPPQQQPTTITQETWDEINSLATEKGVENVPEWISGQLERGLQGWGEITEAEGDRLLETLTAGEVKQS